MKNYTKFAIIGERGSGTVYFEWLIRKNFSYLEYNWELGHKHFYCYNEEFYKRANKITKKDTLLFFVVRDPYTWMGQLLNKPNNYIFMDDIHSMTDFVTKPIYFTFLKDDNFRKAPHLYREKLQSPYYEYHDNIFDLRNQKNIKVFNYLQDEAYFHLIKFEDIKREPEKVLECLANMYNLYCTNTGDLFKNTKQEVPNSLLTAKNYELKDGILMPKKQEDLTTWDLLKHAEPEDEHIIPEMCYSEVPKEIELQINKNILWVLENEHFGYHTRGYSKPDPDTLPKYLESINKHIWNK